MHTTCNIKDGHIIRIELFYLGYKSFFYSIIVEIYFVIRFSTPLNEFHISDPELLLVQVVFE